MSKLAMMLCLAATLSCSHDVGSRAPGACHCEDAVANGTTGRLGLSVEALELLRQGNQEAAISLLEESLLMDAISLEASFTSDPEIATEPRQRLLKRARAYEMEFRAP